MVIKRTSRNILRSMAILGGIVSVSFGPALAQSADEARIESYASILQEIANMKVSLDHQNVYLQTQEQRMRNLQSQIEQVEQTNKTINPMIDKMTVAIENEINTDIPFKAGERFSRLDSVKETVADAEATPVDKMRKLLSIYDIEVGYGQSLEAYDGDSPNVAGKRREACLADLNSSACAMDDELKDKIETAVEALVDSEVISRSDDEAMARGAASISNEIFDGVYLRYGRLSLAYLSADDRENLRYDSDSKSWVDLPITKALEARRAVRIARGQSAPGVVTAPVVVTQ